MAEFQKAFDKTSKHEGGYSNHPSDKGGETFKGVARNMWPNWEGWKIIDLIKYRFSKEEMEIQMLGDIQLSALVSDFYKKHFWDELHCEAMPQEIANELFDTAVNMGVNYGGKCLQNALNKLNRNQKDYEDLLVDGVIGKKSIVALKKYFNTQRYQSRNHPKLLKWLLKWMNYYQLKKYDEITNRNSKQEIFIPGWTERT